jgi:S1-C subfamily serine protease
MTLRDLTPALSERYDVDLDAGVLVVDVQPRSQAAEKNIRPGSVITHVGTNNRIRNLREYRETMSDYEPGDAVLLRISYQGQNRFVGLIIGADE